LLTLAAAFVALTLATLIPATGAHAAAPRLLVGVGRADITPVTGVYKGGWSCTCAEAIGQQERLYARVVVLQEGSRRVALVAEDLFAVSAGMIRDAAALLPGLGFSEQNIIDSASHDHSSPTGYMNFGTYNSVLPSDAKLDLSGVTKTGTDPAMYDFMTRQLALAIRRAVTDLRPGAVGWGATQLLGVTQNRSLGAHLADFGITSAGANGGTPSQDPGGYADTIDPTVNVLRVDQYRRVRTRVGDARRHRTRGRRRTRTVTRDVPVGIFSTFANHGTVDHENFQYYSGDHQGAAERVVEAAIRRTAHVPASQDVVNAFANSDAGDMTSGIQFVGPAAAEDVGRREAAAMLTAWRAAGHAMNRHPVIDLRWTRMCFCGQQTSGGATDTNPWIGLAAAAGSEEGRTIFYYHGLANEGDKLAVPVGPQGDKITVLNEKGSIPQAVPLSVVRIGNGALATVPGEPTVGLGKMIRDAVATALAPAGVTHVDVVGYAGDYLDYFTTPAEYEQQAYEGGFTMYGEYSSLLVRQTLVTLARDLASGRAAPSPDPFDPNHGVHVTAAGYGDGATSASATSEPGNTAHLGHTAFAWSTGGANGIDRPVDRAFVTIQRRGAHRRWRWFTDDLGMQILWSSDAAGGYRAQWEVPLGAAPGTYRFLVTAKRYRLTSRSFAVAAGAILTPQMSGGVVRLAYPQPFLLNDWTYRPPDALGGRIVFIVDGRRRVVRETHAMTFPVPAGASVVIPAGGAHDRSGNRNPAAVAIAG
jgi:neutral ceramidase